MDIIEIYYRDMAEELERKEKIQKDISRLYKDYENIFLHMSSLKEKLKVVEQNIRYVEKKYKEGLEAEQFLKDIFS